MLAQGQIVRLTWRAPLPADLFADANALRRALGNLTDNALRYTPPGRAITLSVAAEGDHCRFTVADEGPGVAPEHLPHLGERFYRADPARGRHGGAGLGLAIVRAIAEAHGGRLEISSTPGAGIYGVDCHSDTTLVVHRCFRLEPSIFLRWRPNQTVVRPSSAVSVSRAAAPQTSRTQRCSSGRTRDWRCGGAGCNQCVPRLSRARSIAVNACRSTDTSAPGFTAPRCDARNANIRHIRSCSARGCQRQWRHCHCR